MGQQGGSCNSSAISAGGGPIFLSGQGPATRFAQARNLSLQTRILDGHGSSSQACMLARVVQGLLKHEGKARYGDQYRKWQQDPAGFMIDDQAPIR